MKTIQIQPDEPCIIANRLAARLARESLIPSSTGSRTDRYAYSAIVEALADELHCDIIDRMTGSTR